MDRSDTENFRLNTEVVVLSTHTMGYGVIRALGLMGIPITAIHYNKSDIGFLSKYVRESIKAPNPINNPTNFINFLLELGTKKNKPLLVPANDETLVAVAEHKNELEKFFTVACNDFEIVKKFINKEETYKIAVEIDIPAPKTLNINSLEELELNLNKFSLPCIIKPSNSHLYVKQFDRKMIMVDNLSNLREHLIAAWDKNLKVFLQEYIPGDDCQGFNFNSYRYEDGTIVSFTSQKIRYSDCGFGIPTCVRSCDEIDEITHYSKKLLEKLNFRGFSCIEYKYDVRDGKYKLMELNGRHNRSVLLALRCDINFPFIEYSDLVLNKKLEVNKYTNNIYWIDLFKDLESFNQRKHNKDSDLKSFFFPYTQQKIFSDINKNDLLPTFKRFFDIIPVSLIILYKSLFNLTKKIRRHFIERKIKTK